MAIIFCPVCGSKSEYKFAVPNFCYKCGSAYNQTSNLNKKNLIDSSYEEDDYDDSNEDEDDFSNSTRVPRISKLQIEIDSSTDVRILKFENLLNNTASSFEKPKNLELS